MNEISGYFERSKYDRSDLYQLTARFATAKYMKVPPRSLQQTAEVFTKMSFRWERKRTSLGLFIYTHLEGVFPAQLRRPPSKEFPHVATLRGGWLPAPVRGEEGYQGVTCRCSGGPQSPLMGKTSVSSRSLHDLPKEIMWARCLWRCCQQRCHLQPHPLPEQRQSPLMGTWCYF